MTGLLPLGTTYAPDCDTPKLSSEARTEKRLLQGTPSVGVGLILKDDEGQTVDEDGASLGRLMTRGHSVAAKYFRHDGAILDEAGWFDTGDIATIDPRRFLRITDRSKDVVKSGGGWISSVATGQIVTLDPDTAHAAVIGVAHPKRGERPVLLIQLRAGATADIERLRRLMAARLPKWWIPRKFPCCRKCLSDPPAR